MTASFLTAMHLVAYFPTFPSSLTHTPLTTTLQRSCNIQPIPTKPYVNHPLLLPRHTQPSHSWRACATHSSPQPPVEFTFDNPRCQNLLSSNSPASSSLPILLYVCGLGADVFPQPQALTLRPIFNIISLALVPTTHSNWDHIVSSTLHQIETLRANSGHPITLVAESFGAIFAMRLVAVAKPGTFIRQYLINPATALLQDSVLIQIIKLLPLLRLDPSQRLLYNAVSLLFFNLFIADESRLSVSSFPSRNIFLRNVDVKRVPLSALLHRLHLVTDGHPVLDDQFIRHHVTLPTILIASGRDRLLQSSREIRRLANVLPQVERQVLLPTSSHAVLFERNVDFSRIIFDKPADNIVYINDDTDWERVSFSTAAKTGKDYSATWHKLTSPKVYGQNRVREAVQRAYQNGVPRPVLFVGNHGVHGILDTSLLFVELADIIGERVIRPLADPIHFKEYGTVTGGRWSNFVQDLGAVRATAKNFHQLLGNNDMILLFPGGGREVCRRRGEQNKIFWNEKANFVRMAAKYNAIIVPFSTIGADDSVDILIDGDELKRLPWIGKRVQNYLRERGIPDQHITPITTLPRPDRFYFMFHKHIDTKHIDPGDRNSSLQLFRDVKKIVQGGIDDLIRSRQRNKTGRWFAKRNNASKDSTDDFDNKAESVSTFETVWSNFLNPPLL